MSAPPRTNRFLRFFAMLGFSSVVTLLMLMGLELLFRVSVKTPKTFRQITMANMAYKYHGWAAFRNTPKFKTKTLRINRFGFRGPEWKRKKAPGIKRVLLLGDSTAFSNLMVREEASIGAYLKTILDKNTGQKWEVLNLAVPGGVARMSLATLAHDGTLLDPDAVLVLNGANDASIVNGTTDRPFGLVWHNVQNQMNQYWDPRRGRSNSRTANLLMLLNELAMFRWLQKRTNLRTMLEDLESRAFASRYKVQNMKNLTDYVYATQSMAKVAAGMKADFVQFLQPYLSVSQKRFGKLDKQAIKNISSQRGKNYMKFLDKVMTQMGKMLKKSSEEQKYRYVDLTKMFKDKQVYVDHVHFWATPDDKEVPGNYFLACRMAKELLKKEVSCPKTFGKVKISNQ